MQFSKICLRKNYTYMQNKAIKVVLLDLHDRYVITPTDKTNNNVALNCTRFYALTSFRELGKLTWNQQKHMNTARMLIMTLSVKKAF